MSKTYQDNVLTGIRYGLVRPSTSSSSSSSDARGRRKCLKDNQCALGVLASLLVVAGVIAGAVYVLNNDLFFPSTPEYEGKG